MGHTEAAIRGSSRARRRACGAAVVPVAAAILALAAVAAAAQPWTGVIRDASEPFTLNSYDVIDAVLMIRRARFLQYWDHESRPRIVAVKTVHSVWVGYDPDAFENHRNRYDIVLNGEPIHWDHLYVEYSGDMVNLRAPYTYRNQQPPPPVPYRLRWP